LSAAGPITTSVAHREGVAVVSVGGEIDLSTAPASEVSFMASVGLRILAATHEKASKSAQVAIVANNQATNRPIQLTGLDKVVSTYPTLDDALSAVGTGTSN
jgi:anti-sigma B factor antagonist